MNQDSKGRFVAGNQAAKGRGKRRFTEDFQQWIQSNGTVTDATKRLHEIINSPDCSTKEVLSAITILFNNALIPVSKDIELDIAEAQHESVEALMDDVKELLHGRVQAEGSLSEAPE